jgi:hypothetical protein
VRNRNAKQIFREPANIRLNVVAGLPERGPHLVRRLLADVRLEEHLHRELARLAASGSAVMLA